MNIEERLTAKMENAYFDFISQCRHDDCLGEQIKLELGVFGSKELDAHRKASELLGTHRAYANVIKIFKEASQANDK